MMLSAPGYPLRHPAHFMSLAAANVLCDTLHAIATTLRAFLALFAPVTLVAHTPIWSGHHADYPAFAH
jgi:hypothetical protein